MVAIPEQNRVQEVMESHTIIEPLRPYIGMSELGNPCQRAIWYNFHWAYIKELEPRIKRIFSRGDYEEECVVRDLRLAGIEVENTQLELTDETGHIRGHIDGQVSNVPGAEKTPHLLEVKTMNKSRYLNYIKKGLKYAAPEYHVQINQYMGRLGLSRCLFAVTNKDNEERNYQRYGFDEDNFKEYNKVGFDVLTSEYPPQKIGDMTYLTCKWCDAHNVCHKGTKVQRNCRTCNFADIEVDGRWSCSNEKTSQLKFQHAKYIPEEIQREGCNFYELSDVFRR